jgi:peptidoglycan/LPS O-acetylase OafA/YrhL
MTRIDYRPEVDGLRALAVIPVILFHAGFELFSGGYVGVDVFFVISGYLITSIILKEMDVEKFSLSGFYERRARRILPALSVVLVSSIFIGWFWMTPADYRDFGRSIFSISVFSSNIYFALTWDYFASWKIPPLMLHTWSLSVEEQFYVLYPLLLIGLSRLGLRHSFIILSFIFVCSLSFAIFGSSQFGQVNFFILPSRVWELLSGALLVFISSRCLELFSEKIQSGLAAMGLILISMSVVFYDDTLKFPSAVTLVPVLGTVLVILFANAQNIVGRLLSSRYLVWIGLISYSAYLWHFPIFVMAEYRFGIYGLEVKHYLFLIIFVFLLAFATYRYIEQPARKIRATKNQIFMISLLVLLSLSIFGYGAHKGNFLSRASSLNLGLDHLLEKASLPNDVKFADCGGSVGGMQCILNTPSEASGRKILLLGDSFMEDLIEPIMDSGQFKNDLVSASISYACPFFELNSGSIKPNCKSVLGFVNEIDKDAVSDIIFSINFIGYLENFNPEISNKAIDGWTNLFESLLIKGVKVHTLVPRPIFKNIDPARALLFSETDILERVQEPKELDHALSQWSQLGVKIIGKQGQQLPMSPSQMYRDKGHFTPQGAEAWIKSFGTIIEVD